jgi:4-amino-4-deoxy-L-arabinose transferase-like glycosyltransferase
VRRRLPFLLLVPVLAGAFVLHLAQAARPTAFQSPDERAYGKLAVNIAEQHHYGDPSTRMTEPLHWPPGAPMLFALAHGLSPDKQSERTMDIPAAYPLQAVLSMGTILAAAALAWVLTGPWAALVAAALLGSYPPLIFYSGEQLSEPLGALLLTTAMLVFALAWRRRSATGHAIAGALFGLAVLTRTDLLLAPFLLALIAAVIAWRREHRGIRALRAPAALACGTLLALGPWVVYASEREGRFVPVTSGGASTLFIGTYLPGGGTTLGMKRHLGDRLREIRPGLREVSNWDLEARFVLDHVAARHPELHRLDALRREARANVARYALGQPDEFAAMAIAKIPRMWSSYARGGARHTSPWIRLWHILLVVAGSMGLALGALKTHSVPLAAVSVVLGSSTALHMAVVSNSRYNLPLMPMLLAGGVAGWFLWWGRRRTSPVTPPSAA